jgi:hypothetical protein
LRPALVDEDATKALTPWRESWPEREPFGAVLDMAQTRPCPGALPVEAGRALHGVHLLNQFFAE